MKLKPFHRVGLLASLLFIITAGSSRAELAPEAQESMNKGVLAAKQQQWTVAIRYFNEAHQAAQDAPAPLFNLGLAEAQLPGRELRAICWFEAYLALAPSAANAPAVRQQITDLKIRAEGNTDKIIELLKVLAGQIPSADYYGTIEAFSAIAGLLALSGDLIAAEQMAKNQSPNFAQNYARSEIAKALAKRNQIAAALKEAAHDMKVLTAVGSAQIAAGLFSDAKETILRSGQDQTLVNALAEAENQAGQHEDAVSLLREERTNIDSDDGSDTSLYYRQSKLVILAATEYKIGLRQEAAILFRQVKEYAYNAKSYLDPLYKTRTPYTNRAQLLFDLALAYESIGLHSTAQELMEEADKADLASRKANEKQRGIQTVSERVLIGYCELNDWDKAESWLESYQKFDSDVSVYEHYKGILAKMKTEARDKESDVILDGAKSASVKVLADAASSPVQRAKAWSDYINAGLSLPLFVTDFKVTMTGLGSFIPPAEDPQKSVTIFDHVKKAAKTLIVTFNDIQEMESKHVPAAALGEKAEAPKSGNTPAPATPKP